MGEGFGQGRLVTQHLGQIVGQRGFNRRAAIGAESSARDLDRFLYWSPDINRLEHQPSRRVSTESDRRVLLSIHRCTGRELFDSSVSRRNAASLLPADSAGLFKTSLLESPRICSAVGLNHRMIASSSVATMPGGIDLSSVSARVFCNLISS